MGATFWNPLQLFVLVYDWGFIGISGNRSDLYLVSVIRLVWVCMFDWLSMESRSGIRSFGFLVLIISSTGFPGWRRVDSSRLDLSIWDCVGRFEIDFYQPSHCLVCFSIVFRGVSLLLFLYLFRFSFPSFFSAGLSPACDSLWFDLDFLSRCFICSFRQELYGSAWLRKQIDSFGECFSSVPYHISFLSLHHVRLDPCSISKFCNDWNSTLLNIFKSSFAL